MPLNDAELEQITGLMADREQGRGHGWKAFTVAVQPLEDVRARLGLRADRPTWVLFTSSDDEVAGEDDYRSPFSSQREWIERTIEYARRNDQIDLVIRVHPNTGGRRSTGANRVQLEEMRRLGENLPPNVRMIAPDEEISSYSLMDLCALGLVWVSTAGLELACKGKQVVVAAGSRIAGTSFVQTVERGEGYGALLDSLLGLPVQAVSPEITRLALRFAHLVFFRMCVPFPLVRMPTPHTGELTYGKVDALRPGRDPGLDRCTRIVLDGEPVCPPPTAAERVRGTEAEDALLGGLGRGGVAVLAFAEELIADRELLQAWADTFDGRDDVTLLIHTPAVHTPRLVDAVSRIGLDRDDAPALIAGELDPDTMASAVAVFSRAAVDGPLAAAPRYDPATLPKLARSL